MQTQTKQTCIKVIFFCTSCGPASVGAVKDGEVLRPHDTNFLFAEVNADKVSNLKIPKHYYTIGWKVDLLEMEWTYTTS